MSHMRVYKLLRVRSIIFWSFLTPSVTSKLNLLRHHWQNKNVHKFQLRTFLKTLGTGLLQVQDNSNCLKFMMQEDRTTDICLAQIGQYEYGILLVVVG